MLVWITLNKLITNRNLLSKVNFRLNKYNSSKSNNMYDNL